MNLFEYRNWKLEVKPEAFTVKAFKVLMDRDKSKDKKYGLEDLAYVYHMGDNLSPFASYLDESRRSEDVIKKVITRKDWKPDTEVVEAVKVYRELDETVTSKFLDSVKIALSKIDAYFRNFNVTEETDSADMKRIHDMIGSSMDSVKSVRELEKLVKQDKETVDSFKGKQQGGFFNDEN